MHAPSETRKSCWTEELICFHNTLVAQLAACTRVISVGPCATTETYNSYCAFMDMELRSLLIRCASLGREKQHLVTDNTCCLRQES